MTTRTDTPTARTARASHPLGARTWAAVILVGLVGQLAWVIENMYLNVFVYDTISTDPAVLAVMVAASAVAATVATLVVGAWSDRLGRRRELIAAGYVAWGAVTATFGLVGAPDAAAEAAPAVIAAVVAIVALDCIMSFIGSGANDAAFAAWVTDSTVPANRGRVDGWLATMPLVAMLIVFGLLDPMTQAGQWPAFFAIVGGATAATGAAAWFLVRDRGVAPRPSGVWRSVVDGLRPSTVRREPALFITLAIWCVIGVSSQVFIPFVLIYLRYSLQLDDSAIVLGVVLILASALSVVGGRIMDRVGKERYLLPAVAVFTVGLVAMSFARDFTWVVVAATLMMAGMMSSIAAVSAMTRDCTPADRAGGVQGARMIMAVMLPMVIGPAIGAAIISGTAHTYVELGREQPVPGPEIFPVAAAVLLVVPVLAVLRRQMLRRSGSGTTAPLPPAPEDAG